MWYSPLGWRLLFLGSLLRVKKKIRYFSTAFISLTASTIIFFLLVFIFREHIFDLLDLKPFYFNILLGVLALDALVVIPFAYLRASNRPVEICAG